VDNGSATNILSSEVMTQMRINPLKLIPVKTSLIRITGIDDKVDNGSATNLLPSAGVSK
jgi:hypothetical protein